MKGMPYGHGQFLNIVILGGLYGDNEKNNRKIDYAARCHIVYILHVRM